MSMPTHRWGAPYRCLAWVLIASLLAASCATRNVPPIGAGGKPFKPESDEVRLWSQAEKEEEALAKKAKIYDDPLLEEYLGKLGDRLLPDEVRAAGGPGFRFGVMSDPTLNAFAMPNGRVYVHSGLLSRLDNEAQLAMILGHEMTHVTSRHALRFTRDATNKQILFTVLAVAASIGVAVASGSRQQSGDSIGAAGLSPTANAILGIGLQLAAIAAINGCRRGRRPRRGQDHRGVRPPDADGRPGERAPRHPGGAVQARAGAARSGGRDHPEGPDAPPLLRRPLPAAVAAGPQRRRQGRLRQERARALRALGRPRSHVSRPFPPARVPLLPAEKRRAGPGRLQEVPGTQARRAGRQAHPRVPGRARALISSEGGVEAPPPTSPTKRLRAQRPRSERRGPRPEPDAPPALH